MNTTGYADADMLLTPGQNRSGRKLAGFDSFVIHGTNNPNPGANAAMHYHYWMPGGAGRTVSSVHFIADEFRVWQLLPIDEVGWHIGDPANESTLPSHHTVAIELCENKGSNFVATCQRAAKVVARVLHAYGVEPIDGVTIRRHGSYSPQWTTHSFCPDWLRRGVQGMTWARFVLMVKNAYGALGTGLTVRTAPRIGFDPFKHILLDAGSPAADVAADLYPLIIQNSLDPAVALAFFGFTSNFGTRGVCFDNDLKSWGIVQTPFDPALGSMIATPDGQYAKYSSWYAGLADWCHRINERYINQRSLDTVEEILPVYAPQTNGFLDGVQEMVRIWVAEETMDLVHG